MSLSSDSSSSSSSAKREEVVKSHANERVSELRARVAEAFKAAKADDVTMSFAEKELDSDLDSRFVGSLSSVDLSPVEISAVRKAGASSSSSSSTSTALVLFQEMPDSQAAGTSTSASASASFSGMACTITF